jgi:hypothetical protein
MVLAHMSCVSRLNSALVSDAKRGSLGIERLMRPVQRIRASVLQLLWLLLCASCATQSVPPERSDKVAVITSGSTNFFLATNFMPTISVVEVDGVAPTNSYGPIELSPGPHIVKLKCSDNISEQKLDAMAGEIYEFAVVSGRRPSECRGSLTRTKSGKK